MDDTKVSLILQFLGFKEFGVCALLLQHLLHKALVCGLGKPALLIEQSKNTRGTGLETKEVQISMHETKYKTVEEQRCSSTETVI